MVSAQHAGGQILPIHEIVAHINSLLEGNTTDEEIPDDLLNVSPATLYDFSQPAGSSGASLDGSYTTAFSSAYFQELLLVPHIENQSCSGMESTANMEGLLSLVDNDNPRAAELYEFLNSL
jgi:hypothetical protein